jgi:hypothetical protein
MRMVTGWIKGYREAASRKLQLGGVYVANP